MTRKSWRGHRGPTDQAWKGKVQQGAPVHEGRREKVTLYDHELDLIQLMRAQHWDVAKAVVPAVRQFFEQHAEAAAERDFLRGRWPDERAA